MQNLKTCFQKLCWGVAWLREAMSVQTECRAMRACSQELCWGAAWLRKAKIQHRHPEIQIFELPNIAPRYCWTEKISLKSLYLEAFQSVFQVRTKMNQDILFYLMPIIKTYESPTFCLAQLLYPTHLYATESRLFQHFAYESWNTNNTSECSTLK